MDLPLHPPTPLEYFASLVHSDDDLPLLEAAASIAQDEEPALDVARVLDDVDRLLRRVRTRLSPEADDLTRLAVLTQVFYKDLGFGFFKLCFLQTALKADQRLASPESFTFTHMDACNLGPQLCRQGGKACGRQLCADIGCSHVLRHGCTAEHHAATGRDGLPERHARLSVRLRVSVRDPTGSPEER